MLGTGKRKGTQTRLLRLPIDDRALTPDPLLLLDKPLLGRHPARELVPPVGGIRVRHGLGALLLERGVRRRRWHTGRRVPGVMEVLGIVRVAERVAAGRGLLAGDDLARKLALPVGGVGCRCRDGTKAKHPISDSTRPSS
jgi:hypothetical protein